VLLAAAIVAFAWALLVWATGGLDAHVAGLTIRTRGAFRPLVAAFFLFVVYAAVDRDRLRDAVSDVPATSTRLAPWLVTALVVVTICDAIRYGSFVAGGSDSYGYLSQAYGWASGHLPRPYAIPLSLPFPSSDWMQTPLGHWLGRQPHTMVPSYSPGLPLLMAVGILVGGTLGPYLVVPLSAGLFVWATYLLARRLAGPAAGVAAALIAATSPVVVFMSLWPMSDVPAGAAWTASAVLTLSNARRGAWLGGVSAAIGILIRPNLFALALLPCAWIAWTNSGRERYVRAGIFSLFVVIAAAAIGALNAFWYGSPFLSGYGDPKTLYAIAHVWPNLQRYPVWLWQSESPFVAVAVASLVGFLPPKGGSYRMRGSDEMRGSNWMSESARAGIALAWGMVVVAALSYIAYAPYDQWWYLRFLLPGLGALFALVACGLWVIASRVARPWGRVAAVTILAVIAWRSASYTAALDMFGPFKQSEHKYADVGRFIAQTMGADAVFFALQHSGTIRYYGGRHTLRYDLLDRNAAAHARDALERLGLHPYLAIEDAEIGAVRKAFGLAADRPLPWPYVARMNANGGISIYDLATHPSGVAPVPIEPGIAPPYSPPRTVSIEPRR
jgi:hypothetical protein